MPLLYFIIEIDIRKIIVPDITPGSHDLAVRFQYILRPAVFSFVFYEPGSRDMEARFKMVFEKYGLCIDVAGKLKKHLGQ